jgi:hypothetical protein
MVSPRIVIGEKSALAMDVSLVVGAARLRQRFIPIAVAFLIMSGPH